MKSHCKFETINLFLDIQWGNVNSFYLISQELDGYCPKQGLLYQQQEKNLDIAGLLPQVHQHSKFHACRQQYKARGQEVKIGEVDTEGPGN